MSYEKKVINGVKGVLYTSPHTTRFYPNEPYHSCQECDKDYGYGVGEVKELHWYKNKSMENKLLCTECLLKALKEDKIIYENYATK